MNYWRSGNNGGGSSARSTQQDLELRLAPPTEITEVDSGNNSDSSSASSCVSSGDSSVLVLGACRSCWIYCMVTKKEFPTCIKCKLPCLVGFTGNEKRG